MLLFICKGISSRNFVLLSLIPHFSLLSNCVLLHWIILWTSLLNTLVISLLLCLRLPLILKIPVHSVSHSLFLTFIFILPSSPWACLPRWFPSIRSSTFVKLNNLSWFSSLNSNSGKVITTYLIVQARNLTAILYFLFPI